jgi:hypothetical protein
MTAELISNKEKLYDNYQYLFFIIKPMKVINICNAFFKSANKMK